MRRKLTGGSLGFFSTLAAPAIASATDYFGSGQSAPPPSPGFAVPGFLQYAIAFVATTQRALIDMLTARTGSLESGMASAQALSAITIVSVMR